MATLYVFQLIDQDDCDELEGPDRLGAMLLVGCFESVRVQYNVGGQGHGAIGVAYDADGREVARIATFDDDPTELDDHVFVIHGTLGGNWRMAPYGDWAVVL